jgi:hypothetical protein
LPTLRRLNSDLRSAKHAIDTEFEKLIVTAKINHTDAAMRP